MQTFSQTLIAITIHRQASWFPQNTTSLWKLCGTQQSVRVLCPIRNSLQQGLEYHHLKMHYFALNLQAWITLLYSKLQLRYFGWQYDFRFCWAVQNLGQIGETKFLTFFVYIYLPKILLNKMSKSSFSNLSENLQGSSGSKITLVAKISWL